MTELGGLEIWVNNAAIFPATGPAIEATDEFIDRMLTVNVRGTFAGAREAARRMPGGGVIVNMVSTTGFKAAVGISAYVTSKHAVVGATKALALEFASLASASWALPRRSSTHPACATRWRHSKRPGSTSPPGLRPTRSVEPACRTTLPAWCCSVAATWPRS